MGPKTSRHHQRQRQQVVSNNENNHGSTARGYARWDPHAGLTTNDVSRSINQEMLNFQKHHRVTPSPIPRTPVQQEKIITVSSPNKDLEKNKPRYDQNRQKPKLGMRKSRSVDNLSDVTSVITVKQLLNDQSKRKRRNKSPSSRQFVQQEKLVSSNKNLEKNKPRYDQNMQKPKLGMRKSRSVDNLSDITSVITVQQLLNDQSKRKRRNKSPSSQISTQSTPNSNVQKSSSSTSTNKSKTIPDDLAFVSINPNELQNAREIGRGNFGTVYHALYKGNHDVAIKTLHRQDENTLTRSVADYDESIRELLYEAHIMTRLKHPNLLRIIGVTFFGDKQQISLVTDFMKNGSLLNYLRKNREIFLKSDSRIITTKINSFAWQIFEAMSYLEERRIIHRDLAARNCLIGVNDTLKVGDFGLSTLTECGLYKGTYQTKCAPRWTSPEAVFSSKFSSRSDVWSYGITLWEIYSLGDRPFGNMSNFAVQVVLKNSSENISRHLPKPSQFASDETYTHIILPCLTYNVTMRPRFKDLRERLVTILVDRAK